MFDRWDPGGWVEVGGGCGEMEMEEAVMRSKEERVARKGMAGTCDVTRCCGPLWPRLTQQAWQCASCHFLQL